MMKLFYTSDVHGSYFATDYTSRDSLPTGLISMIRNVNADVKIDGGDTLQGNALSYFLAERSDFAVHGKIFTALGYDYIALGNHDFNFGYDGLKAFLSTAPQAICANLVDQRGELSVAPYVIVHHQGCTYGITSVVTDWVTIWDKDNLEGLTITDPFEAAKAMHAKLSRCDVTLLIYHGGYERDLATDTLLETTGENIGCQLIDELDYDMVLTAHQHQFTPGQWRNHSFTLQNQANAQSAFLIDINRSQDDLAIDSTPCTVQGIATLPSFDGLNDQVQNYLDQPLATLSRDYLPEDHLTMALHGSDLANLINKILLTYFDADVSLVAFANDITGLKRDLTIRDVLNTYKFTNLLEVVTIDVATLKAAINHNIDYVLKDGDHFKINPKYVLPKVEHYNFDFFYGVDYTVNYDATPRVSTLYKDGRPLDDKDTLRLLINSYRKSGAGGFSMYTDLPVVATSDKDVVELLINYFKQHGDTF
ncbi:5'-nucleotidase C-terminal domain-containing protein [Peptoniphilus equinus]|uniref:5'-nucleotidase C-terminal domain-containing protein n=1 Tax=Peptoniphilus equinus TaxID=3016343 RepID=A0ABY7QSV0_9FIRM|nr:5'-nucleotidase C-terminal domain-containing protein [Peptoniphilus equinus]WBW49365.1 5'-nucleotidase C-terminal domain-containing protein [Peptoniphilus equinus]